MLIIWEIFLLKERKCFYDYFKEPDTLCPPRSISQLRCHPKYPVDIVRLPLAQLSSWRNKHSASKLCLLIWFLPPNAPPGHQRSGRGVFRNVMRKEFAGAANFLAVFFVQIEAIDGGYDRRRLWSTEATTDRRTKSRHFHFIPSRRYRRRCQNRLCLRRHRRLFSVGHHLAPADIFRLQIRNNIT